MEKRTILLFFKYLKEYSISPENTYISNVYLKLSSIIDILDKNIYNQLYDIMIKGLENSLNVLEYSLHDVQKQKELLLKDYENETHTGYIIAYAQQLREFDNFMEITKKRINIFNKKLNEISYNNCIDILKGLLNLELCPSIANNPLNYYTGFISTDNISDKNKLYINLIAAEILNIYTCDKLKIKYIY